GAIEFIAGTEATFIVQARDAYGNALDEQVGEVTASIEWEAYNTLTTMNVLDDTPLNNAEFGRYFYGTSTYIGFGQYEIKYTALREGSHKLFVKINGGNVYNSPFNLRGDPAAAAYGAKSLAESTMPPSTVVAGDEITFQVQLRDAYGNILPFAAQRPVVAQGFTNVASVQVGGVEISKLEMEQVLSQLNMTQGPFALFVAPAAVSPANTAVYNVQSSYLAGVTVDALVQLRDQFGNNRTSSSTSLLFQGRFGPSTLAYTDHNDGTVTVKVGTHLAGQHPLQITLAGVQISNTPTPEIPVNSSLAKYDGTDCAIPAQVTAGIQSLFQCFPRDTFGNKVVDNDIFIEAEFVNMDDSSAPVVTVAGTYSLVDDNYDFPLQINKVGAYSVVTQLWARGGLIGRYYRTPGFQSLVSLLTDRPHQGLALFEYTRVDPQLNIIWPESPVATCPEDYYSVHWHGYLLPKATGLHNIRIEADRGARVMVGSAWVIDEIASDTAVRASAQVTLTNHVPEYIEVQYKHSAGTAYVRLYWAATEFEDELVPSQYLLHPLNVPHPAQSPHQMLKGRPSSVLSGYLSSEPAVMLSFTYLGGGETNLTLSGNYTATVNPVASGSFQMHVLVDGMAPSGASTRFDAIRLFVCLQIFMAQHFFIAVFAPEGWPSSVAPEYGRYQLWDTIQQVTFFVNTVISKQAVMKFHGVGDPNKTPAEATALEMGRGLRVVACAVLDTSELAARPPGQAGPGRGRPIEVINAVGHFIEILAAIFTQVVSFLYLGPALCLIAGTMSGAVRSVILQHFAKGGTLPPGKDPDFGDISLKESNQDKAGKIVGLCVGVALLLGFIGIGSGVKAEATSLERSLEWFLVLTIVHLLGNIQAVRQLEIAQDQSAAGDKIRNDHERKHILWEMFLPKGYPHTVVDSYTSFRAWSLLNVIIGYPKQIVTSMLFWGNVYGVGNSGSSPVTAVLIDIFMATVDCVVGLLSGLPIMAKLFNYSDKKWYYISGNQLYELVRLLHEYVTLDDARLSCVDQGLGVSDSQRVEERVSTNGLVINPKPIDSTSGVSYVYAFTTFFPEIRRSTDNSVIFQVRDEFGNDVPDQGNNFMFCEADGPEQKTTPFRPPLDAVRYAPGLFRVNLKLETTGVHKVNCYALNKGGINARYFNNRWVEGVPAISQVDTAIDFNWGEGLVTADSSDYASAQFDGYLQVPTAANYTFYITCDDGANLWIDDELVLSQASAGQFQTRPILLTGARLYHLQVMYYERTGFARMRLEWSSDQGLVREVIGKDSWFHSRSLLGLFPQTVLVYDKPGPVEAFYHHDFEYDVNQLSWVPPQDNSAKSIVGYRIYRDNGQGGAIDTQLALLDETTFSYRDASLVTGQVYYYRLMATNGDDGEPVTISAQPSVPPVKPDPALLINTGTGSMTFRFTPLSGAPSGWSPTIRYTLYRNDGLGGVLRFQYEGDMDGTSTVELVLGGLVEGRQYLFQTSYWSRIGQSPLSDVTAVVCCEFRKPGSPALNLRREGDQSNEKITLAWDPVTDIGSSSLIYYRLYMDDGYTEISKNTASGTTTTEFFEFLTPGNPYRFAVAAVNAAGEGPRSERITLTASDVAGQPYDVEATFQSSYRIDLAWKKPLLTGASGMSGYKVWVDDGNGGNINNLIWDGGTKASTLYYSWEPVFSDGSVALLAGHTYRFQVQSVNPTGDGAKSNLFSIVAAAKPDSPGRPTVDRAATSSAAVHLSWTAPYNGGSPILGYIVERKDSPTAAWTSLTTAADSYTSTTYVDSYNLAANSFYIYRVSAFNLVAVGDTMYSPEATIPAAAVPSAPTVSFVTSTETTITVSWDIPLSDLTVTGFRLFADNVLKYDGAGVSTVRTFTLAGCSTGNMHDFRATAISDAGESGYSASLPRYCARRPYPPAQPTLKSTTLSIVEIQWMAPSNNGGMPISGYKVQRANHDTYFFGTVQCLQTDNTYLTILPENQHSCLDDTAFLCPSRKCKYRVLAINGVEDDNFADVSPYLVATAANLPIPPSTVTRDDPPSTKTAIEVQWPPVTSEADTGGALVIGYRVYANTGIDDSLSLVFDGSGSPSVRSFKHTGLTPGRRYWYQVSSVSSVGEGTRSGIFTFLAAEPPTAPLQPRFVTAGFGSITIGLDPPPSDGGSPIVRYAIYHNDGTVNGLLSTQVLVCDMSRTEFAVPNLLLGRDYQIQIQAHADCPTGTGSSLHEYDASGLCVNDADCTLPGDRSDIALYTATDVPDVVALAKVDGTQTRTAVTFRWAAPGNDGGSPITSYEPYRDDGLGGDFVRVDVLPTNYFEPDTALSVTGNEYKYSGLVTGRRYNFFMAACNKRGCRSGSIYGPLTAAAPPNQPDPPMTTGTSASPPAINFTWTPPENGGMPILKTVIERDDGQDDLFTVLAEVDAPDFTYSDAWSTGAEDAPHVIQIQHEQSSSEFSNLATFVAAGLPSQPDAVTLVSQSTTNISVSWTTPASNGADIFQFILRRDDGLGSTLTQIYRGAATSFESSDLATGRYYSFTVAARSAAGEGPESTVQRFLSASMPAPVRQPVLISSSCSGGSLTIKWTVPEDDGGCPVIRYRILRDDVATGTEVPSTTVSYFTAGLECATTYRWSIQAKNCLDTWGSDSPYLETYTASLPGQVTGLNATHVSSTELLFNWMPLLGTTEIGSTDFSILRGYELWMDDGLGGKFSRTYDGYNKPFETYFVATGLVPGRVYRSYVRGINLVGAGPDSDVLYRAMAVEPSAPSGLQVETAGAETVLCSWKPPQDNGGEPVLHYVLEYAPEPLFNTWQEDGPYPDNTQFTKQIFNLNQGMVYQFRIRAVTNAGGGSYSNVVSHVVGTAPLSAPSGLTRAATTSVSMTWAWLPLAASETGGAPLGGYRLYMNTGRDDVTALVYDGSDKPSATEFTATSLVCGRIYKAEVSAVTSIGEGPRSSIAAFKLARTPSQPRSARVVASSTGSITLAWDIPESTGCTELEYYRIERDSGQGFEAIANVTTPIQTFTDSGSLSPGQMYIYRITARNDALEYFGPHSAHVTAFAASLPGMTRNLGYVASTRPWWIFIESKQMMALVVPFKMLRWYLTKGRPYRFRVAAETVVGTGPYTSVFQQALLETDVETVPGYMDRSRWGERPSLSYSSSPYRRDATLELRLGYKVTFDGQCDRYDGTSVSALTSAGIPWGWGGPSPSVSRVCGAEPSAPVDLRLKMSSPSTPLDMVDQRTPSSMTLTWDEPTLNGGAEVKSYQLYRDAGDASGIYTLTYVGTSRSASISSLTNGRTYRFYAVAVNDVGAGERTAVFAAEMRCTPRTLVAAPYKDATGSAAFAGDALIPGKSLKHDSFEICTIGESSFMAHAIPKHTA
ncbi:Titin (Connectin), partial [Durusdinium trenchii]